MNFLFSLLSILSIFVPLISAEYLRPCYFTNWAHYREGVAKYEPENYIPGMCTHILFAFAKLNPDFTATANDPQDLPNGPGGGYYARVNKLKEMQPGLKTLLSIGGWSAGTAIFKQMASNADNRQKFVNSAIDLINEHNFDGIDIDWEYPEAEDKENYVLFMQELKQKAGEKLVSVAVTADPVKTDAGYDVSALGTILDFVNVMTYDFHGEWEKVTGENSPLFGPDGCVANTAAAMNHWAEQGMPKNKLLAGIASYGRGWMLDDPENNGVGAPGQVAPALEFTKAQGFGAFYEICTLGGTRHWDDVQKVPYMVKEKLWYGYDDEESVGLKMQWVKDNGFGGAFVWTLDFDDFTGMCPGGKKFPLISKMASVLEGGQAIYPPTTTNPRNSSMEKRTQNISFICPTMTGYFADPIDCASFYQCVYFTAHHMRCAPGTQWNRNMGICDYPQNTVC